MAFFTSFSKTLINKAHKHNDSVCFIVVIIIILNAIKSDRERSFQHTQKKIVAATIRVAAIAHFYGEFCSCSVHRFSVESVEVHKYGIHMYRYFYDNIIFM